MLKLVFFHAYGSLPQYKITSQFDPLHWMDAPGFRTQTFPIQPMQETRRFVYQHSENMETPWNSSTLLVFGGLYVDSMENLITNRFHGKLIAMVCWKKNHVVG